MNLSIAQAKEKLLESGGLFVELFSHGTLTVEFYKPDRVDNQKPHERDEIYVIASGEGEFINDANRINITTGDFLFVKAGKEHRFINFTDDFSTWVFFYGPKGGE